MTESTLYPRRRPTALTRGLAFSGVSLVSAVLATTFLVDDALDPALDMQPPARLELAAEDNADTYLRQAFSLLEDPEYGLDQSHNLMTSVRDPEFSASEPQWQPDLEGIGLFLERHESALRLIDRASRCPQYQGPEMLTIDQDSAYAIEDRQLSGLVQLRTAWAHHERRWDDALESALCYVRVGKLMAENPTYGLGAMMGIGFQSLGDIGFLAAHPDASEEFVAKALAEISRPDFVGVDMALAVKRECRALVNTFDNVMEESLDKEVSGPVTRILFYKRNRTLNGLVAGHRAILARLGHERYLRQEHSPAERSVLQSLLSGNAAGEVPLELAISGLEVFVVKAYRLQAQHDLERLAVAVRLHELRHGKLPTSLDELVPGELPALPVDPFSGESYRYAPGYGRVFSVGRNGRADDESGYDGDDRGFEFRYEYLTDEY